MQRIFLIVIIICCFRYFAMSLTVITKIEEKKISWTKMMKVSGSFIKNSHTDDILQERNFTTISPKNREIKLNAKQSLIMNQILNVYALSGTQNPLCRNHTMEFKKALRQFEPWALKMFDSSSKLQAGILVGDLMDYGSFRQCIEIYENFDYGPLRGQHCVLKITPNIKLLRRILSYRKISSKRFEKVHPMILEAGLLWSVCIPDSCSPREILHHFNRSILTVTEGLTLNISLSEKDCYSKRDELTITHFEWTVLGSFGVLLLITSISTAVDVKTKNSGGSGNRLVNIFSVYSNAKKLLATRTEKQALDCLHGIRFLSMCYVVLGHRYLMLIFFPLINSLELIDWILNYTSTIIIGGTICVDTFFMISGLLVTYTFFNQMSSGKKFNLTIFWLHRYLRVTPSLMVVVLVYATLIQHLGTGPLWRKTVRALQKPCQYFWWSALLHIQNYTNPQYLCIIPSWYLACDTQFYFLSPILLYPLWKHPILGYIILILVYILAVTISFYLAWMHQYEAVGLMSNQFLSSDYFKYHYITSHSRAPPFIIGIAFGYILFKTNHIKIKMNPFVVLLGWFCSLGVLVVTVLSTHIFQLEDHDYNRLESSIFISWARSAWTLGVIWIIWACSKGYGGPVDYLLSFPIYQILGRLSYAVFLIHMGNQFMMFGAGKSAGYFTDFDMIFQVFGDLVLNLSIAFVFTLIIESPIIKIEGLLMNKAAHIKPNIQPDKKRSDFTLNL